jgi:predicted ATPase
MPFYVMLLADVLERTGNSAAALERLEEALHLVELTKEKWYEAQLHRAKGELLKSKGSFEAAEADFVQALSVARCQNAKMWELRSAASLARLWRDQGKRDQAHELLAPVCGWFNEGFDTLDLKDAKALLEQLVA